MKEILTTTEEFELLQPGEEVLAYCEGNLARGVIVGKVKEVNKSTGYISIIVEYTTYEDLKEGDQGVFSTLIDDPDAVVFIIRLKQFDEGGE